jgi:hypothetical protein
MDAAQQQYRHEGCTYFGGHPTEYQSKSRKEEQDNRYFSSTAIPLHSHQHKSVHRVLNAAQPMQGNENNLFVGDLAREMTEDMLFRSFSL